MSSELIYKFKQSCSRQEIASNRIGQEELYERGNFDYPIEFSAKRAKN